MDEREAEEKRDAEIRSGVVVAMRPIVDLSIDDKSMRIEIGDDGAVIVRGDPVRGKAVFTALGWDRLCYAVELARLEAP